MKRIARWIDATPVVLLPCLLIALVMVFHHVVPLGAIPYAAPENRQDCYQMVWNLWFAAERVAAGRSPYFAPDLFYPVGANLAHHTLSPGFAPVTLAVKAFARGDAMYPIYAYRILVLLCFAGMLAASYALLRRLRIGPWASAIAASAYTFSDFYMLHAIHLNLMSGWLLPIGGLAVLRLCRRPTPWNAFVAALVPACGVYFTELALSVYMAAAGFAVLWWAAAHGRPGRPAGTSLRTLALAALAGTLPLVPYAAILVTDRIVVPDPVEAVQRSANLASFVVPSPAHTPLYGRVFAPLSARITSGIDGSEAFAGYVLLVFGLLGVARRRTRAVCVVAVLAAAFFCLSLGPVLQVFGTETRVPLPYAVLGRLPVLSSGRTPVRFVAPAGFMLMILAAHGLRWIETRAPRGRARAWRGVLLALVPAWAIAEAISPVPRQPRFVPPPALASLRPGPVLDVPPLEKDGYAALLQTFHHQPIGTGYLARITMPRLAHVRALKRLFAEGGPEFSDTLARLGFENVIISPESLGTAGAPSLEHLDLEHARLRVVDLRRRAPAGSAAHPPP